jgi:hypothetical protein
MTRNAGMPGGHISQHKRSLFKNLHFVKADPEFRYSAVRILDNGII